MSMNFQDPINDEARELIKDTFLEKIAVQDERTVLLENVGEIHQKQMKAIANAANQPAVLERHGIGDIKVMANGTKYEATVKGWRKVIEEPIA